MRGRWKALTRNPQPKRGTSHTSIAKQDLRKTGKPRLTQDTAMIIDYSTPEVRMECVGKTCCAGYRVRRLPEIRFLELAKGFEPLTL